MAGASRKARSGELINRTYELEERLAMSPLCEIYRAQDRRSGRKVRLKLLRPELALQASAVDGFLSAPRALTGTSHPNLAAVIAIDSDATGIPFVVEECVEGETLATTLERFPQGMPAAAALAMLTPLVDALVFTHARGATHGQIDREHVVVTMVGGHAVPKLLSCAERSASSRNSGGVAGAPFESGAERADLRALGVLLHEVLLGQRPSRSERSKVARPAQLPASLAALLERCLTDEVASVAEVLDGLRMASEPPAPMAAPSKPAPMAAPSKPAPMAAPSKSAPTPNRPAPTPNRPAPTRPSPEIGLAATLFAERSAADQNATRPDSRPAGRRPDLPSLPIEFPTVDEAETARASQPSRPPRVGREPAAAPIEIKTLSDLAAAFAPIEGGERIGQVEVEPAAPEPEKPARGKARGAAVAPTKAERRPPLPSPKQLRERQKPVVVARAMSEEQMRAIRERGERDEKRYSRWLSGLLFFLFAFSLAFAVPVLCDPSHTRAQELFGKRAPLAMAGFAGLALVALVRTWALQISARPMLLRPVTLSLKVVVAAICVLASGFFLPAGALGPAARWAGWALPWGGGMFYLFLAIHGVTHNLREAGSRPVQASAMALLYCVALFGGHRVLATTVLSKSALAAQSAQGEPSVATQVETVRALANGQPLPVAGAAAAAGAADTMVERKEVGASESDDMAAVDALDEARKKKSGVFEQLGGTLRKVTQ